MDVICVGVIENVLVRLDVIDLILINVDNKFINVEVIKGGFIMGIEIKLDSEIFILGGDVKVLFI